ncbi:FAD/NAD(P)-binding domain-containing protein [Melanomma pulvis-pyrius CBS 109.77]|uniref:FAD/NAD(P)-binding domain-containing protein n=1 Tax=Melanomma pulvis-pyrius CBS 109.77 TaxID=1314802 RepID=A0A6A6WU64_9PLEO|nr:FAD/NAD(P)-binding domain-containing protein [Melanomma pulvis-pyrius CBS 109.77]
MASIHIIIIGAGVSGLALAQGLSRRNISFSVYERDGFLDSRRQGYRLKIFGDMKGRLHDLLTPAAWTTFEGTCAQSFLGETNLNATDASITACRQGSLPPGASLPFTVDRGLFRQAMMTGISASVHFGKEFERYEDISPNDGGGVRVFFADGSIQTGTLLVGADGARSRVRAQLIPRSLDAEDTGTCCIYGKSPLTTELLQRFPPEHRRWITVVRDEPPIIQSIVLGAGPVTMVCEPCLFNSRDIYEHLPPDYVHWGILFRRNLLGLPSSVLEMSLKREAPRLARQIASEWHPSIKALIELQDDELTSGLPIFSVGANLPEWDSAPHVTVMGDAVHTMSPTGGVGAVAALNDACELVRCVETGLVNKSAIAGFEHRMREFARACVRRTNEAGRRMLDLSPA